MYMSKRESIIRVPQILANVEPEQKKPTAPWKVLPLLNRVDASGINDIVSDIDAITVVGHKKIALDLKNNRFICMQAIEYFVALANELANRGGEFALIACAERTKHHFEIYGSLKNIRIVRSEKELDGEILRISRSAPDPFQELP